MKDMTEDVLGATPEPFPLAATRPSRFLRQQPEDGPQSARRGARATERSEGASFCDPSPADGRVVASRCTDVAVGGVRQTGVMSTGEDLWRNAVGAAVAVTCDCRLRVVSCFVA